MGSLEREPRGQWQLSGRRDGRRSREQRPAYPPPTREGRTCTNTAERRPESASPKPAPTTEETAGQGKAPLSGRAERAGGRLPAGTAAGTLAPGWPLGTRRVAVPTLPWLGALTGPNRLGLDTRFLPGIPGRRCVPGRRGLGDRPAVSTWGSGPGEAQLRAGGSEGVPRDHGERAHAGHHPARPFPLLLRFVSFAAISLSCDCATCCVR